MKARMIVIIGIALLILGFATGFRSRHIPLLGPPAPVKKWEFAVANSIVQNCTKPGSPFYNVSSYKCDHRIPDFLPEHSPAIDSDGTIYAGGAKGLYALHPDGTVKWLSETQENGFNFQAPYHPVLSPFIDDAGQIWFDFKSRYETGTAGLFRVDANGDGKPILSAVHTVTQAGLLEDGTIFVLWDQTRPAFFDPDGTQQPMAGAIANGMVRQAWWDAEFGVPSDCHPPSFGAYGLRFVGCKNELIALDPGGSVKWSFPTPGHWASQPAIAEDGTIYFGSADSNVYALNSDGQLKWKFATGDEVHSTPAIAKNGTIFFGSNDHHLYAVGPDGKARWAFETGGPVYSPTIGPDATVYALSADGKLYAIQDLEQNGGLWGQWPKFAGGIRNDWRGSPMR